ncbi:two-component system sensor histidine kinase NtrB [Peribacillus alkalitolerans]|uniref:two-component system sensor histidine kinase NtrB n=1 Tax=Peribacillus alkalitolerans TaxID=1550385 RepID=UPI0013D3797B|nr:ATP-binding protein [Peribacillus alkalitolerans]
MMQIELISHRNTILVKLLTIILLIDTLVYIAIDQNIEILWPPYGYIILSLLWICIKSRIHPKVTMYIIVSSILGFTFYLTIIQPYISNFIFMILAIIISTFYQQKAILIFATISSIGLQITAVFLVGTTMMVRSDIDDIPYFILFSLFTFLTLLYMVTHSNHLWTKNEQNVSKTKADLHSTKSLYESIFAYSQDPIAVLSVTGEIMEFNEAFCKLFEMKVRKIKPPTLHSIFPDHQIDIQTYLSSVLNGKSVIGKELKTITSNHELIIGEATISPIYDSNHTIITVSLIIRNVTERRKLDEYITNSEKLKVTGEIAAGVAHEIRNPLQVIGGFVQMLNEEDTRHSTYYSLILSEIKRMNSIISEFLKLSKPLVSNLSAQKVREILEEVIVLFEQDAHYKNIEIEREYTDFDLEILCEVNQLKQVFINLVKNSIEAIPNGGLIKFQFMRVDENKVKFVVSDNGVGIPEEIMRDIGKPFFTTKETGTGLGLMITERIIEQHNGSMAISSFPGKGTTVEITLPIEMISTSSDQKS